MQEVQKKSDLDFPLSESALKGKDVAGALAQAMLGVETRLREVSDASGPAKDLIWHLVGSGGKRIRPRLTLLIAGTCPGFNGEFPVDIAVASELIHTASLLHDDVIDEGDLRRGKDTARRVWSNTASVLAGDHCLASAVELIRGCDTGEILAESLQTVQKLVSGELLQLQTKGTLVLDEDHYRRICDLKTASLFVWCSRAGARFADASEEQLDAVGKMADSVGLAFQIRDDLLDVTGDARFGKRLLDDLREGRMTLPVIRSVKENPEIGNLLQDLYSRGSDATDEELEAVQNLVAQTSAIESVALEVQALSQKGVEYLHALPKTEYRDLIESQIRLLGVREV